SALFEHEKAAGPRRLTNGIGSEQFYESDSSRGFARGFWFFSTGYTGPVSAALGEPPEARPALVPAALRSGRVTPIAWGAAHHEAFQQQANQTANISIMCEELPLESNRVELHPTLTDDSGIPAV